MTRTQHNKKYRSMLKDVRDYLVKEGDRFFRSGGIDTGTYKDDYVLPKPILIQALRNCAEEYKPLTKKRNKELSKLKHV